VPQEAHTVAVGTTHVSGVALRYVMVVDADPSYDVSVEGAWRHSFSKRDGGGTALVAIRSIAGKGQICLGRGCVVELGKDALIVVEGARLQRYHCTGASWKFWWFEFFIHGPLHLPMHEPIRSARVEGDIDRCQDLVRKLRAPHAVRRRMASLEFLHLLYEWFGRHRTGRGGAYDDHIERVVNRMHDTVGRPWQVQDMAKFAGMSEGWFRREFRRATGRSPKQFFDRLRMAWAQELLSTTPLTVAQISDRLGFSSPFHFSRAFKKHFDVSPSSVRET
jgi:AraC-like DNA-binding protein